jgi:hypothetical protein
MSINFNVTPYFDDFNESKQFLRVLFRPGYAVQARELTQLQTILQNQISRFGNHVFKNGSMVVPGEVNFDNQVHFAKLEDLFGNTNVTSYLTQFRDKIITGQTSGVKAVVIDTSECGCMVSGDSNVATLYFKMTDTADDGETKRFILISMVNFILNHPLQKGYLFVNVSGITYCYFQYLIFELSNIPCQRVICQPLCVN